MIKSAETQRLIDNLNTAVLIFDPALRLCGINTAGEDLLSSSSRMVWGQSAAALFPDCPLSDAIHRSIARSQPLTQRDVKLRLANGSTIKVDCTVTPLSDPELEAAVLVEFINVGRHRRIVREEHMIAQHNTVNALVRGIAHEIKNPLGGLRGAAQLLERELDNEAHKEYTRIIIEEADRLKQLLDRMATPNRPPQKCRVNVHEVLEHVRNLVEVDKPRGVEIIRDYDPSLPELLADPHQLIQAQLNILKNAVQAVGARGKIFLRTRSQRQSTIRSKRYKLVIRVDVIDDGPGVPQEIADSIFYPLSTGRAEGTGLGLPIAQSLIHLQGGLIEFVSKPNETIFTIWLPIDCANDAKE
jgi:two-component system nitrogen regulation sensor histidine kinase GlnL